MIPGDPAVPPPGPDPGGFDLQGLLDQAQQVQQQLARAQEELAAARVAGTAGGGLVTATVTGTGELVDLRIEPAAVDLAEDDALETVADLVLAAVRDAAGNAQLRAQQSLGPFAQGFGGGLPGLPGAADPPGV